MITLTSGNACQVKINKDFFSKRQCKLSQAIIFFGSKLIKVCVCVEFELQTRLTMGLPCSHPAAKRMATD